MSKPVILTGLRANNDLHIGNYFGGLLPLIDMAKNHAEEYDINLFVPDLHSFTTPIDHKRLQRQIMINLRLFVAAGLPLDNENIHIYRQSYIQAHSELTVLLNNFTYFGEMSRMTQFKDKTQARLNQEAKRQYEANERLKELKGYDRVESTEEAMHFVGQATEPLRTEETVSVGLFDYPVLMAADILLYGAKYVPVGDDQTQHLEITRDIAIRMNNKFGELFIVPEPVNKQHEFFGKDQGLRIKDLVDPTKKMSKSSDTDRGLIFLGYSSDSEKRKIMSATTDSEGVIRYNPANQPGIANLLQILALCEGRSVEEVASDYKDKTSYGDLKTDVAEAVGKLLDEIQDRLNKVDDDAILDKLHRDEAKMNQIANQKLAEVQKAIGLRS